MNYLIKDITREEREKIVEESLGNISASCDGCSVGIAENAILIHSWRTGYFLVGAIPS